MADSDVPSGRKLDKEVWVRRFAVAAFMANREVAWPQAQQLGERFWTDFKHFEPEDVARAYSER